MDIDELRVKYRLLLKENQKLKKENTKLKQKINELTGKNKSPKIQSSTGKSKINNYSPPEEKINLFMNLFKGRDDVFAKRWESKKGNSGYSPICLNEWDPILCKKPSVKCSNCKNRKLKPLEKIDIKNHLSGKQTIGIYPLLMDNSCYFLAMDFDKEKWKMDITAVKNICREKKIPLSIERSRSGNGGHIWFFFNEKIEANEARRFGTYILTCAMSQRHEINFSSYDRLFPSQDILPKGGYGNLIALPLQKECRKNGNSVFINDYFEVFEDQWAYLSGIDKISKEDISLHISNMSSKNELGSLKKFYIEEKPEKSPRKTISILSRKDFPEKVRIIQSNMIHIEKENLSNKVLNEIKRLAAFKNPEFYRAQAMRLPVYNKPRIVDLSEETENYLSIPRGCYEDLITLLENNKVKIDLEDKRNPGEKIDVSFKGTLKENQNESLKELIKYENGILTASPGFGKTIVAIKLIAERKTNTLILVHTKHLLEQWKKRLEEFLIINTQQIPKKVTAKKVTRGRKRKIEKFGQIGSGKKRLTNMIDIALMQSVVREGEVKEFVKNYGMVIVDECHHVPAFSFETIMKNCNPKYVLGLTATPSRKDGHHPIIFMQCGSIRYNQNTKNSSENEVVDHYLIPKFTSLRLYEGENDINQIYKEIVENKMRNKMIVEDVIKSHKLKRNILVLTERVKHVALLYESLQKKIPHLIKLTGKISSKTKREELLKISSLKSDENFVLIATGKLIGEGFDEPRLDTLIMAMPVSWKGKVTQYAGRIQRIVKDKKDVLIYDYIDINVPILDRMYQKRLKTYKKLGYTLKIENDGRENKNYIYETKNFFSAYFEDITKAKERIIIVSPIISLRTISSLLHKIKNSVNKKVEITIITKTIEEQSDKQKTTAKQKEKIIKENEFKLIYKKGVNIKFSIIDQKIIWYGSLNILGYNTKEEIAIRIENEEISNEFLKLL